MLSAIQASALYEAMSTLTSGRSELTAPRRPAAGAAATMRRAKARSVASTTCASLSEATNASRTAVFTRRESHRARSRRGRPSRQATAITNARASFPVS